MAKGLKDVPKSLIQAYRKAPVKHADQTGWRTDGQNGYSWLFCTPACTCGDAGTGDISIFRFGNGVSHPVESRAASVAKEVFGEKPLPGVLVVDRYNGYNKMPCSIQYCYADLLRMVKDLEKDFAENAEIRSFVEALARQLAKAISLGTLDMA